jgi:hypothetical protein
MTISKEENFTERMLQIYTYVAKNCTEGKQAENLFNVAEKAKKRSPVVFMAPLSAFCAFDPLFVALVSRIQPGTVKALRVII